MITWYFLDEIMKLDLSKFGFWIEISIAAQKRFFVILYLPIVYPSRQTGDTHCAFPDIWYRFPNLGSGSLLCRWHPHHLYLGRCIVSQQPGVTPFNFMSSKKITVSMGIRSCAIRFELKHVNHLVGGASGQNYSSY